MPFLFKMPIELLTGYAQAMNRTPAEIIIRYLIIIPNNPKDGSPVIKEC
jgi:hypothetical protein